MKILIIGGTGTLSFNVARFAAEKKHEVYLFNRGSCVPPKNTTLIKGDINCSDSLKKLKEYHFDIAINFISFFPSDAKRDLELFSEIAGRYVFISTASVFEKRNCPYLITEKTNRSNPYWEYSRNKIACEDIIINTYEKTGFPVTIIRPSHTYDHRRIPIAIHGKIGNFQSVRRIIEGKPVLIPGDGTSLWTVTHASDFAEGFLGVIENKSSVGEDVNVVSGEALPWNTIYDIIGGVLNKPVFRIFVPSSILSGMDSFFEGELLGDKANSMVFDISKLKSLVPGFSIKTPAEKGISDSLKHILADESLQPTDFEFDLLSDKLSGIFKSLSI